MATIHLFVSAKKRESVPIYVRYSDGREVDLIVKTGLFVNPARWSNDTETIKQRIKTDEDDNLINSLHDLKGVIRKEGEAFKGEKTKAWLRSVVDKFHNINPAAGNLNGYIDQLIEEIKSGKRKTNKKKATTYAPGSVRVFKGFKTAICDYQGIYSTDRLKQIEQKNEKLKEENKPLIKIRPLKRLDFSDITVDFRNDFVNFLYDVGYAPNTIGRHIKILKLIMRSSTENGLHRNQEFKYKAFQGVEEDTFSIVLNQDELDRMYKIDLSQENNEWLELARDAWFILYETCLRVSDYSQIDVNIKTLEGRRIIDIHQTKTGRRVLIPLTQRFEELWKKHSQQLPVIKSQMINKQIKVVARLCEITEMVKWRAVKYGKEYERSAEKCELVSCHTARRTGATILWKEKVPLSDIMLLLGHATEKQTRQYLKVTPEEAVLRLADHPHYAAKLKAV